MRVTDMTSKQAPHFVLIHGIGGGAWCWYKLRCLMENSGYKVSCIELTSGGIDRSDASSVQSFDEYSKPLTDFFSELPENQKVILVGHSAGGLSVTSGESPVREEDRTRRGVPDLSDFGDVYEVEFGADQSPISAVIKKEFQRKIIYNMSPLEDSTLAAMLLRPGPLPAIRSAQFSETSDIDKVPRVYIKTMHDNVVKPAQQEAMIKRWPPSDVYVLESDHSPFFSTPFLLFGLLVKAAASVGCH
uniref:AB hydrolase-1 domain-containing protein n=1 Tax=Vitis vinifera TaxID=29760 RepID=A5AL58_VITVI|nr:hypothetical protein VITISV_017532 [Vitis vinifera]